MCCHKSVWWIAGSLACQHMYLLPPEVESRSLTCDNPLGKRAQCHLAHVAYRVHFLHHRSHLLMAKSWRGVLSPGGHIVLTDPGW